METFSRSQQLVVLLIIFGMSLLYFHSINQPSLSLPLHQGEGWGEGGIRQPAISALEQRSHPHPSPPPSMGRGFEGKKLPGAKLLTLNKQINLNTATSKDLEAIPGIGQKTAENIVDYRKNQGRFKKIEDIMKVPGIKKKRFEKIKRYLTVKW